MWTRDTILAAIRDWATEHGEPPAVPDWNPYMARQQLHDEARARRAGDDRWPHPHTVRREFGSWAAALAAAGYEPRAPHGGAGNQYRRRKVAA